MSVTRCLLCNSDQLSLKLVKAEKQRYWDCSACGLIFLEKEFHLNSVDEKNHYLTHNNDIHDPRYQKFVSPIVDYVSQNVPAGSHGLDYGAGPGPVISYLLKKQGYEMSLYDPYFCNDQSVLTKSYDFIVVSEVVEHFYKPANEFHKLKSLLNKDGHLAIMTDLYADTTNFDQWHYHRDPTHVVFYRMRTFEWIKDHYGFKELVKANGRAVVLLC
jgi:hypothetical protein